MFLNQVNPFRPHALHPQPTDLTFNDMK